MFQEYLTMDRLLLLASAIVILFSIFVADRLARRAISKYSKKIGLEEHVANILKLVARILVIAAGLVALMSLFGISAEWFVGLSALTGAAIGFASTQTVGNFLAGLYIMISRPFMVNDYVRIGDVEGEVREITINYTKIYTPTYTMTEIPNRRVLDSIIVNHSGKKNIIDYTFQMGYPHMEDVTNEELVKDCILPTLKGFHEKHTNVLPKKPELSMSKFDRLGREFSVRLFFPECKIDEFYNLQPELMNDLADAWDKYKSKKRSRK